tara:strand:+ start:262 stop:630 length:369 start_codon:yes stop_codon:yes gene_type:complete
MLHNFNYYYGDGTFSVESNGQLNGLQISFTGNPTIISKLPEGWNLKKDNYILVIWASDNTPLNYDVFDYTGTLKINKVLGMDFNKNKIIGKGYNNHISYWNETYSLWDSAGEYENYNKSYTV